MASEGRKFDLKKLFSNHPRMCPEALGVALSVAKHLGTILTSVIIFKNQSYQKQVDTQIKYK